MWPAALLSVGLGSIERQGPQPNSSSDPVPQKVCVETTSPRDDLRFRSRCPLAANKGM